MKTILITGGCGFIGSNFIRYALQQYQHWHILNLDKLTYAGNRASLADIENDSRYTFIQGDICDKELIDTLFRDNNIEGIIHFAAESHVDRSIIDATPFVETNVKGTMVLLDAVRQYGVDRFLHISTDEVYGELGETGYFNEDSPLQPNSPYAESKASADLLVHAYVRTFSIPAIITRSSNNFGPYQYPEKLIPLMILNAIHDEKLPVYGDGLHVRDWIYVEDNCSAIGIIFNEGKPGETYNISSGSELTNIDVVRNILKILGKPDTLIQFVKDRPGHDRRYALDNAKLLNATNWKPSKPFDESLIETITWYKDNERWWRPLLTKDYNQYRKKIYGEASTFNEKSKE